MRYFQYGDTLKRLEDPDLVVDDRIDIIITHDRVAVLDDRSFQTLFSDVGAAWVQIRELCDEPYREVLVEEQHRLLS